MFRHNSKLDRFKKANGIFIDHKAAKGDLVQIENIEVSPKSGSASFVRHMSSLPESQANNDLPTTPKSINIITPKNLQNADPS